VSIADEPSGADPVGAPADALRRLRREIAEHATLASLTADVGIALTQAQNLDEMLRRCAQAVVDRLGAAFARIWTLSEAEQVLELQTSAGLYTHIDGRHGRVPVGKFKIGLIAEQRKPHLTNQVIGDPRVAGQEWARSEGMVAFAGYPLMVGEQLVGVLAMFSRRALSDADFAALSTVANAVAVGIGRARAWEALNRRAHELAQRTDELSRLTAALERSNQDAQAANAAKDEFLATLSHELRTPLNAILGWARLLAREALDPAGVVRAVATIERNALLQVKLIDDLLDVSRIISGQLTIERTAVDLGMIVAAAVESARPSAEAQGVTLHVECCDSPSISGDAGRLQQVITNLLSNAIKFTPRSGQVRITIAREVDRARLSVADSGEGIDPAFVPHMFERFSQADRQSRRNGGLGLGLSIVRHIVDVHGGTVEAASEGLGRGTTVTVWLPAGTDRPAIADVPSQQLGSLEGLRVLVVDDHEDGREMVATVLERCGARVCRAASASEAVRQALLESHDIVVSDISMPNEDGYALIQQLRAMKRERFQALALTALATRGDRAKALGAGFDAHLAKPVEPQVLVQTLLQLVAVQAKE